MMKQITTKVKLENGAVTRKCVNMLSLLNLNVMNLLNKTKLVGYLGIPQIKCDTMVYPDYFATYREKSLYTKSKMAGVCFYSYDVEFDGVNGLFNAIYYNNKKRLEYFKERFKNIKFIVTPDYSVFGDMPVIENLYRIYRSRIVALWFVFELHAVVIPNISYADSEDFSVYFSGLETCSVVAFNAKGHIRRKQERNLLKAAVKYAVDNLPLKTIMVYSACGKDATCFKLFNYAMEKGIIVRIVNNSLRERNMLRRGL